MVTPSFNALLKICKKKKLMYLLVSVIEIDLVETGVSVIYHLVETGIGQYIISWKHVTLSKMLS